MNTPGFKQNAVSQAVWPWINADRREPSGKTAVRLRSVLQSAVMCVVAMLLYFILGHKIAAAVVLALALVVLLSGMFAPPVFRAIDRFGLLLGRLAGVGLTWLLLVPFFYLCFVPGRILLRLRGTDPLKRKCPSDEATYWNAHKKQTTPDSSRKQF